MKRNIRVAFLVIRVVPWAVECGWVASPMVASLPVAVIARVVSAALEAAILEAAEQVADSDFMIVTCYCYTAEKRCRCSM